MTPEFENALTVFLKAVAKKYNKDRYNTRPELYGINFENDKFKMRKFYIESEWHFRYKPTGYKVNWYKHIGNGMIANKQITFAELNAMITDLLKD